MRNDDANDRPLPAAAAAALAMGHMVEAIKYVREAEGLGLMEAKQRVEAFISRDPVLKVQIEELQARTKRKLIQWFLVIDVLLILAAFWYFFGR